MAVDKDLLSALKTGNPQEKTEILLDLHDNKLDDESLKTIVELMKDNDKGIRNNVETVLISNPRSAEYIVKYISSVDISVRNFAGELLVKIGTRAVEPLLTALGKSDDHDDQKFIIDVLGLIGEDSAASILRKELKENRDDNVKLACIETLGNLKDTASVDLLMEAYKSNELFKPSVIEALGKIGSSEAADFMFSVYDDEDDLTKYSIVESLGLIGNENTFFFLISMLNETPEPLIGPILKSINRLKEVYNLEVPFDEKIKNVLLNTIYNAQPEFKKAAIFLLTQFNDKEMISAFIYSIGEDEELDYLIRNKFLENAERALPVFPALLDKEVKNTTAVLSLLTELLENSTVPLNKIFNGLSLRTLIDSLSNYLTDPDEEVRRLAMNLLFCIDPAAAILFSDKMVNDDNLWNKLKLIENICDMDDPGAGKILQKLTEDSEVMVSKRAAELLNQRSSIFN